MRTNLESPVTINFQFAAVPAVSPSPSVYYLTALPLPIIIRESVDSLCRDGADMPRPPYIGKACTRPNLQDLRLFR